MNRLVMHLTGLVNKLTCTLAEESKHYLLILEGATKVETYLEKVSKLLNEGIQGEEFLSSFSDATAPECAPTQTKKLVARATSEVKRARRWGGAIHTRSPAGATVVAVTLCSHRGDKREREYAHAARTRRSAVC